MISSKIQTTLHRRKLKKFIKKYLKYKQYGLELRRYFVIKNETIGRIEEVLKKHPTWNHLVSLTFYYKHLSIMVEKYTIALSSISFSEYEIRHFMIRENTR